MTDLQRYSEAGPVEVGGFTVAQPIPGEVFEHSQILLAQHHSVGPNQDVPNVTVTRSGVRVWTGVGPPGTVIGAAVGDYYLDLDSGDLSRLDPG